MDIKVLGPGCRNCKALKQRVKEAVAELNIDAVIDEVTDPGEIVEYGVAMTPGLIVNGEVKSSGRVPTKDEIKAWLS